MNLIRQSLAILGKDLLVEWQTKERLSTMTFFVLLTLLVFHFSFDLGAYEVHQIGPGVLWSSFIFSSLFGLQRAFADEREDGGLDALLLAPISRSAIYLGKASANLVFMLVIELISLPLFALFFNLSVQGQLGALLGVFVLGSAGIAAVGTLFAAMCSNLRLRELLLPLLLVPLIMPALIASVKATALILTPNPAESLLPYLRLLAVYTIVFVALALLLFEFVAEE